MSTYHPHPPSPKRLHISTVQRAQAMIARITALRQVENAIEQKLAQSMRLRVEFKDGKRKDEREMSTQEEVYRSMLASWMTMGSSRGANSTQKVDIEIDGVLLLPVIGVQIAALEHELTEMGIEV